VPLIRRFLLFDVLFDKGDRRSTTGAREITWGPEHALPVVPVKLWMLFSQQPGENPFQAVDQFRDSDLGRVIDQQMHMVTSTVALHQFGIEVPADVSKDCFHGIKDLFCEYRAPIFRNKDQVHMEEKDTMPTGSDIACLSHRPSIINL
jgi:hypothetical protein